MHNLVEPLELDVDDRKFTLRRDPVFPAIIMTSPDNDTRIVPTNGVGHWSAQQLQKMVREAFDGVRA